MKEEEDYSSSDNSACVSQDGQDYELEFVQLYEQLPLLWDNKHQDYTNKYKRGLAYDELLKIMIKWDISATRMTVRQKINVLRSCYRRELRKHLSSKAINEEGEEIYTYNPKSWKFYALRFIGGKDNEDTEHFNNSTFVENSFEDETTEVLEFVETPQDNPLETYCDDNITQIKYIKDTKRRKRFKNDKQDYNKDEHTISREYEAIGSNVVCKLKRMNPEQRYHAELLINKVLIEGLKNSLTEDTDLTEVYKCDDVS